MQKIWERYEKSLGKEILKLFSLA